MDAVTDASGRGDLVEINPRVPFLAGPWRIWRNLREHRHIVSNFISRDIRLKYRDSSFGFFWSLLEPLGLAAVFFVMFTIVLERPQPRAPLHIIIGVIVWGLFSRTLTSALTSLSRNGGIIKSVYFPREIFAVTTAGAQLVLCSMSLLVAIPFMFYYGIRPSPYLVMVPAGMLLATALALGVGMGLACVQVVNRDIEHVFKFLVRAGMFLSPVMWTLDMPGARGRLVEVILINPLAVPITMVRNGIDGRPLGVEPAWVAYSVGACVLALLGGAMVFKRCEAGVVKQI
jgi:ABC-type polysaccharide/polyol phosphate export permease